MLMCEFLTAAQHKLPVKAVVYNNSSLGLITLEAESMGLQAWKEAIDFTNPDYVGLARACGGVGFRAEKPGELREAIDQALKAEGPAIVDCVVPAQCPAYRAGKYRKFRQGEGQGNDTCSYRWVTGIRSAMRAAL
jgi:pyruvate dehydrogenase (quinone)